ncbi:hypothetical protein DJ568_06555 [Mucilaginibacter hurinus]|uniref:PIN domain-containing protein n=1 Tax=Mucilaginibacter hurinus TaxID=2201324 RepID=A0A367GQ13_9SPHI|nr:PIN domain-containing protein [Mucilaginibacter hurinus]RCH55547.1 hypothetical protein DJ568_06555 [Mucilaginibacter hurinus]
MTLFIDTDVILDTLLIREPHFSSSVAIMVLADKHKCCTSVHGLLNVHYFTKKKFGEQQARKAIEVLSTKLTVIAETKEFIDKALLSAISDFEDAVQFYSAKSVGADAIITRNLQDYKQSTIPVYTPNQFLKTL